MKRFTDAIRKKVLVYDGSKGTMLQREGLKGGECPELWNITHPDEVRKIYEAYKKAGSDVIQTNTFQGNRIALEAHGVADKLYELNYEGARLAREVMGHDGYVAASIGPTGKLFEPSGDLTFKKAYEIYKEQVKAVIDGGVDIINFETFTDIAEMRAALIAAKDTGDIPVICSMAFESNGRTLMGTDPYNAAVILSSLGADMVGANCSLGPEHMLNIVKSMSQAGVPLSVKPNAGLPKMVDGCTVFDATPKDFADLAPEYIKYGARLIGGCCGTFPEFITAIRSKISNAEAVKLEHKAEKVISSSVELLKLDDSSHINIGYIENLDIHELTKDDDSLNTEYITDIALDMASGEYDAVCIRLKGIENEQLILPEVVNTVQEYIKKPLIIDTDNYKALDGALKLYKGKAGIVIDGCDMNLLEKLLYVAGKYGSTIISI